MAAHAKKRWCLNVLLLIQQERMPKNVSPKAEVPLIFQSKTALLTEIILPILPILLDRCGDSAQLFVDIEMTACIKFSANCIL